MRHTLIKYVAIALTLMATTEITNASSAVADSLLRTGTEYMLDERYIEALDCLIEGMETAEKEGDTRTYISCLGNIGSIYGQIGNWDRSLDCLLKVYTEAEIIGDSAIKSQIIINLFGTYIQKNDLANAKKIFIEQTRHPLANVGLARHYFLYNQGELANLEGNTKMAEYYFVQAAEHARASSDTSRLISQLLRLGQLAMSANNHSKARIYADSALAMSTSMDIKSKIRASYRLLETIANATGDSSAATHYRRLHSALNDSMFNAKHMNQANNRLFDYEKKINDRHISSLNRKINVQWQTIVLCVALLVILAGSTAIIIYNMYKLRQTQKLLLKRNEELEMADDRNQQLLSRYIASEDENSMPADSVSAKSGNTGATFPTFDIDRIMNNVNRVMENIDIISRHDFSLLMLANEVNSNTKYVSTAIKMTYGKTFKEFLNSYRIREACRRMADKENYGSLTIEAIYKDLGYNSASGFIEAFKRINGMTPSTYNKLVNDK